MTHSRILQQNQLKTSVGKGSKIYRQDAVYLLCGEKGKPVSKKMDKVVLKIVRIFSLIY